MRHICERENCRWIGRDKDVNDLDSEQMEGGRLVLRYVGSHRNSGVSRRFSVRQNVQKEIDLGKDVVHEANESHTGTNSDWPR